MLLFFSPEQFALGRKYYVYNSNAYHSPSISCLIHRVFIKFRNEANYCKTLGILRHS
jgi:hypothetical protein